MFGYVRARRDTLPEGAVQRYDGAYCGLCRTLGERYGPFSRLFLNYDFAFLAMLLAPEGEDCPVCRRPCPRHPVGGRDFCRGGGWMETAAAESVILAHWKLRDAVADSGPARGLGARFLDLLLRRAYRRARADCPGFDRDAAGYLEELRALEGESCPSMDRAADAFAKLLRAAAPRTGDERRDRALGELLYHLGRWIYLIDGADDLAEDREAGRYNPVLARFPAWTAEDQAYLRHSLDHSLARMGAAFQILPAGPYTPVVENVIYSGLPGVEELVFSGKWRQKSNETQERRL